jgi:coenzyme F420 hydrogenase subunit beta
MSKRTLNSFADVVNWGLCVGCGACAYGTKGAVRMQHVEAEGFRPVFEHGESAQSPDLLKICPGYNVNGDLKIGGLSKETRADHEFGPTLEIWEGWASDPEIRFRASSGGILSALSLYCLEEGGFKGVIHAGMDAAKPWMNRNYISRSRADVLARTGSRYAPSAPCAALDDIDDEEGPFVFIGKPCDASAVSELLERVPELRRKIGLVVTFFCAGTPSTRGTLKLLDELEVQQSDVKELHYRGEGWPGDFRVTTGARDQKRLSYKESWGKLTSHRPLRCNLCPDGLGRVADIACGDAWEKHEDGDGNPGRSLVLVRTERGREVLASMKRTGWVTLERGNSGDVLRAQTSLLERRRALFGRLVAFRLLGVPLPSYRGFSLFRSWASIGPKEQLRTVVGTIRRILMHRWYRRRERGLSSSEVAPT